MQAVGFRTFVGGNSAVAWLPKWHFGVGIIEFRVLRVRSGRSGPGRGPGCPRLISGVVGIDLGGRSRAGGQPRKWEPGTGSLKTWRAATFWGTGGFVKARGDRIFSVGGADLWFAAGCGTRTPERRPGLRFGSACGGLRRLDKLRGLGWAAAKDLRWGLPNCDPGLLSARAFGPYPT